MKKASSNRELSPTCAVHIEVVRVVVARQYAVCHDKLVSQQFAAHSGLPHDDESSH